MKRILQTFDCQIIYNLLNFLYVFIIVSPIVEVVYVLELKLFIQGV